MDYVLCAIFKICNKGGQLDKLQEPHFRRQFRQEPCINKIKSLHIWWLLISVHPATVGYFQSVISLLSLENFLKCLSWSACVQVNCLNIVLYEQHKPAATVTCANHKLLTNCTVAIADFYHKVGAVHVHNQVLYCKGVWGAGSTAPHIPNLYTRWWWVVSFMLQLFYPCKISP